MSMEDTLNLALGAFASLHKKRFDVMRPDYTATESTESSLASVIPMRVNVISNQYSQPNWEGPDRYTVISGIKDSLQEGDVIAESGSGTNVPVVTVLSMNEAEDVIAFRTNLIGSVYKGIGDVLYSNVRYDFYDNPGDGQPVLTEFESSIPTRKALIGIHTRAGINPGYRLVDDQGIIWQILSVKGTGHLMLLSCKEDDS